MTGTEPELVEERHGSVLVLRLNRPDARNALTAPMLQGLGAAVAAAGDDPEIRVVVLTGTGDRAFCAGMDLASFAGGQDGLGGGDGGGFDGFQRLVDGDVAVPVIGAINGSAVGGGFELMLGCDIVLAVPGARFGSPEVKRGLFPGGSGTALATRVPMGAAMSLLLTGELVDAERGQDLGLVHELVEPDQLLGRAIDLAEQIAGNAPLAVAAIKELVRLHVSDPAGVGGRLDHWRSTVFRSDDAREGAMAFMEKREPRWQGR